MLILAVILVFGGLIFLLYQYRPKPTISYDTRLNIKGSVDLENILVDVLIRVFESLQRLSPNLVPIIDFNEAVFTRKWRRWWARTANQEFREIVANASQTLTELRTSLANQMSPDAWRQHIHNIFLNQLLVSKTLEASAVEQMLRAFNARMGMVGEKYRLTELELLAQIEKAQAEVNRLKYQGKVDKATADKTAAEMEFETDTFNRRKNDA